MRKSAYQAIFNVSFPGVEGTELLFGIAGDCAVFGCGLFIADERALSHVLKSHRCQRRFGAGISALWVWDVFNTMTEVEFAIDRTVAQVGALARLCISNREEKI